jgi:hypothetical protein
LIVVLGWFVCEGLEVEVMAFGVKNDEGIHSLPPPFTRALQGFAQLGQLTHGTVGVTFAFARRRHRPGG